MDSEWYSISAEEMDSILALFKSHEENPLGLAVARERKEGNGLAVFPYETDYVKMGLSEWPEPQPKEGTFLMAVVHGAEAMAPWLGKGKKVVDPKHREYVLGLTLRLGDKEGASGTGGGLTPSDKGG